MRHLRRPPGLLNAAEKLQSLTEPTKRDTKHGSFPNEGGVQNTDNCLPDDEWFDLVERLIELSPADFTAAVTAAKLYRRFEEGNRRVIPGVRVGAMRQKTDSGKRVVPTGSKPRTPPAG